MKLQNTFLSNMFLVTIKEVMGLNEIDPVDGVKDWMRQQGELRTAFNAFVCTGTSILCEILRRC